MGKHENSVVRACMEYLTLCGIPHFRNNSGAVKTGKAFLRFGAPGWPDIVGVLPGGKFLGVECKAANPITGRKGTQSEDQRRVAQMIGDAGGLYVLAFGVEDLARELRAEGVTGAAK